MPFLRVVDRRGQLWVEEILDTLVALGHARRTDSGYAPA